MILEICQWNIQKAISIPYLYKLFKLLHKYSIDDNIYDVQEIYCLHKNIVDIDAIMSGLDKRSKNALNNIVRNTFKIYDKQIYCNDEYFEKNDHPERFNKNIIFIKLCKNNNIKDVFDKIKNIIKHESNHIINNIMDQIKLAIDDTYINFEKIDIKHYEEYKKYPNDCNQYMIKYRIDLNDLFNIMKNDDTIKYYFDNDQINLLNDIALNPNIFKNVSHKSSDKRIIFLD